MSKTIAFFGATGDCAGHCLAHTLTAGYTCTALARTPSKLTASMQSKGVPPETLDRNLTIVQGDARDVEAVMRTLKPNNKLADLIIVGVGAYPKMQWSIKDPIVQQDPTICQDTGSTILRALAELNPDEGQEPLMVNVSTTGIPPKGKKWDVPFAFSFLYRTLLHNAHVDKIALQENLAAHVQQPNKVIRGFINVKASLLMDGEAKGLEAIRFGTEDAPEIGYTIRRSDVGLFIFERLVKEDPDV